MMTIPRSKVVQFLGFLTAYLPELKGVEAPRLLEAWEQFIAKQEQRRSAHESRLTELEGAAVSYVRGLGSPFEAGLLEQLRKVVDDTVGSTTLEAKK